MSGFEVVGVVLGALPVVTMAIKMAKGRTTPCAYSWSIKLTTETLIFHGFVRNLLASDVPDGNIRKLLGQGSSPDLEGWKDPLLSATLLKKLGKERADNMLRILQQIGDLLKVLAAEITKISSGLETMGKLRTSIRNVKIGLSQGPIDERLAKLHNLNEDLVRLLNIQRPPPIITALEKLEEKPENKLFLHRDFSEAEDIYEVVRHGFSGCKCKEAHVTRVGYHCPSCDLLRGVSGPLEHEHRPVWELIFQPKSLFPGQPGIPRALSFRRGEDLPPPLAVEDASSEAGGSDTPEDSDPTPIGLSPDIPKPRARSISVSLQSPPTPKDGIALIENLCSAIENAPDKALDSQKVLGIIGRNKKTYNMCINEKSATTSRELVSLEELLSAHSERRLLRRERMVLALRLSAVVLQFYRTPWIDDEWSWKNFAVPLMDEDDDSLISHLLVQSMFYSAASTSSTLQQTQTGRSIISHDEPILTRLGFALTELAMDCTLEEMRKRELKQKHATITDQSGIDQDTLKLLTCFRLLESGMIARAESHGYEAVVSACLKHQYRDQCKAGIKGLDSGDQSFFDNVEEAIITPLYKACSTAWRGL